MIITKSQEFNIYLNAKDLFGRTAFYWTCMNCHSEIAKMIIKKSAEFNIELNVKNYIGRTAYHSASYYGSTKTVEIMIEHSKLFDFTLKDNAGRTGFQVAKENQKTEVIKLIRRKMPSIAVEN